jgi:CHC2-type zinc finger protein
MRDTTIFERHLDLTPLRGRRRGLTHCLFHGEDRRPSLSVDLDAGLFNCFACGARGGVKRFAELMGERPMLPTYRGPESDLARALGEVLRVARAWDERRAAWLPWWLANDLIRLRIQAVRQAHDWTQVLGPDHPRTWPVLELAARVETEALADTAQLDQLLEEGRLELDASDAVAPILARVAGRS